MTIVQAAMTGIVGVLLIHQLHGGKKEFGIYLAIAISLILFFGMSGKLGVIARTIQNISKGVDVENHYIQIMMKMLGVVYVAEFASGICKDAGYQTISTQIEIFAKLTILALGLPVIEALLLVIQSFLE